MWALVAVCEQGLIVNGVSNCLQQASFKVFDTVSYFNSIEDEER